MPSSNTIEDKGRLAREAMWFQSSLNLEKGGLSRYSIIHIDTEQTLRWRRCRSCYFLRITTFASPRGSESPEQNGREKGFFKETLQG